MNISEILIKIENNNFLNDLIKKDLNIILNYFFENNINFEDILISNLGSIVNISIYNNDINLNISYKCNNRYKIKIININKNVEITNNYSYFLIYQYEIDNTIYTFNFNIKELKDNVDMIKSIKGEKMIFEDYILDSKEINIKELIYEPEIILKKIKKK